jgi:hypothetical protein
MTVDRIMALAALVLFAIFLGIVALSVKRVDLFAVCAFGLALAGYDVWRQLFRGRF